jgi:hypothetical protein
MTSYDDLRTNKTDVGPVVEWHMNRLIKTIYRKLTTRQTFRNPYKLFIVEPVCFPIFFQIFSAIKAYRNETTAPAIKITTNKPGRKATITKDYTLTFLNFYSVLHFFTHILNFKCDVLGHLTKQIKNCNVKIVVDPERPFVVHYKRKKEMMYVSGHFEVVNEFGVICSL